MCCEYRFHFYLYCDIEQRGTINNVNKLTKKAISMRTDKKLVSEVQNKDNLSIISMKGSMTAEADEQLFHLINTLLSEGITIFVFDLGKIIYINSAGYGILIALIDEIRRYSGKAKFVALSPHLKKTAKLIGLHRFVDFYHNVDEALLHLESS